MPEGFDDYQTLSDLQAQAKLNFLNQANTSPTAAQFNSSNAAALQASLAAAKVNSYVQVETDLARVQDQTANVKLYQTRTNDLDGIMSQIKKNNDAVQGQLTDDKAVTKRQFEINEWYNYKKQATANALSNLALVLSGLAIVVFCWKTGFLPSGAFYGIAALLVLYGVISSWQRFYYMDQPGQDALLWHRRRFGPATAPPAKQKCDPLTGELIPSTATVNPCLDAAAHKLARLIETNNKDLQDYLQGTTTPTTLCSGPIISTSS